MFRGFFHGLSDYDLDARDEDQVRLSSVPLTSGAFACRLRLRDLDLSQYRVQVKSVRRPNAKGLAPTPEVVLEESDLVVLQGTPDNLARATQYLLTGK
jgi:CPA2 family monovalent cation:H+ antiporter-2